MNSWEATEQLVSELNFKLKNFRLEPQSTEQALANIRKMRSDLGIERASSKDNRREEQLREILKRAGPFTDEILASREKERE